VYKKYVPAILFSKFQIWVLTYRVRYIFTTDGKYLLGGMMVGGTSDYVKLVSIVKKMVQAPVFPATQRIDFLETAQGTAS
jgi:hypothetical protein